MILAEGRLYDTAEQDRILSRLEADINRTRQTKSLAAETVMAAVERLGSVWLPGTSMPCWTVSALRASTPISRLFCPC